MIKRLAVIAITSVSLLAAGCSSASSTSSASVDVAEVEASASALVETTGEPVEGDIKTETVNVGGMDVTVPEGLKLPDDAAVTSSDMTTVMFANPTAESLVESIRTSAEEAGYELVKEVDNNMLWVGHGNAVLLNAADQGQILTWGPEAMADQLLPN